MHYGRASLCPVSTLPAFFVLPKDDLDVWQTVTIVRQAVQNAVQEKRRQQLQASGGGAGADGAVGYRGVVVLLDQAYQHALVQLQGEWGQQADQERQAAESGSGVEVGDCAEGVVLGNGRKVNTTDSSGSVLPMVRGLMLGREGGVTCGRLWITLNKLADL